MTTTSPSRAPRRDAAENRAALLSAAKVVLNRDPSAPLEAIAAEAGLSRRSVYGHFATRDDLLLELVMSGTRRIADALARVTHPDPLTRLALIATNLWREVESVRVMAVVAIRGPLAAHTAAALDPIRMSVREAIRDGQAGGTMRQDISAERLARLVEHSALGVLEESAGHPLGVREGHQLVMLMALGAVGLGWHDAERFITGQPELQWKDGE
ncbi:MAG TPA: TetR/AcrR family transcriptional regulator [Lacisediminihabitans sp.]|uniref:TetR/AcrR family transcriptional regulator n=1 Tax=Lacisediminihabitans sp. TaxID=2787631 RepID=UPI002ED85352